MKTLREKIGLLADDTERAARWAATMARDWMGLTPRRPACCSSTAIPQTPRAGLGRLLVRPAPTDPRQRRGSHPPARRGRHLPSGFWLREIRKLNENARQTSILSTRYLGPIKPLAAAMFAKWHQETFFKYMRQYHGLDRMVEQGSSPIANTTRLSTPPGGRSTARCVLGLLTLMICPASESQRCTPSNPPI